MRWEVWTADLGALGVRLETSNHIGPTLCRNRPSSLPRGGNRRTESTMVAAQVSAQPNKAGGTSAVDAQMSVLEIGDECVLLDDVTCAICLSILHEPASLQCGHTFCSRCVQTALRRTAACPVCRQPASQVLAVNHLLSRLLTQTFPEETKAAAVWHCLPRERRAP